MNNKIINNFLDIEKNLLALDLKKKPKIIAVSKTFPLDHVMPLLNHGHLHFGENKVQEAKKKWTPYLSNNDNISLHMIGKLQTNKVKDAVKIFKYVHSLDNEKLALELKKNEEKFNKKLKYFIQVNIGEENQKSGVSIKNVESFYRFCKKEIHLNILGLMAIPPNDGKTEEYFEILSKKNEYLKFNELSLGMTNDYSLASKYGSTFLRIGTAIFGERAAKL